MKTSELVGQDAEATIIRNQRLIMLGLSQLLVQANNGNYTATLLRQRVQDLERDLPWIVPPSRRIS